MASTAGRKKALQRAWITANEAGHGNQQVTNWCVARYPRLGMSGDMLSRFKRRLALGEKPCGALERYLVHHGFLKAGEVGFPEPVQEAPVYMLPTYEDVAILLVKATLEGKADLRNRADELVKEWAGVRSKVDLIGREYEALSLVLKIDGRD